MNFHVGLRKEAYETLRALGVTGIAYPSEAYVRDKRVRSLEVHDDEAYELWSRILWKLYVKDRYARRAREALLRAGWQNGEQR